MKKALAGDAWILDGNYTRTIPIKWEKIDMVIWLDYAFSRVLVQALRRAIKRSITKEELWAGTGNRESFNKSFFSKDSIILWAIKTHRKVRRKYESFMIDDCYSDIKFVKLRSPFLSALGHEPFGCETCRRTHRQVISGPNCSGRMEPLGRRLRKILWTNRDIIYWYSGLHHVIF